MLFTLLKAIVLRPRLVAQHVQNYGELLRSEAQATAKYWVMTCIAWFMCAACLLLFIAFAGMAVMIGFTQERFHWILILVPGIALLLAVVAGLVGMRKNQRSSLGLIQQQFAADMAVFAGPARKENHEQ